MSVTGEHSEVIDVDAIKGLIKNFEDLDPYERDQKKERQVQNHFIEPLLEALGWNTDTDQVMPEQRTLVGSADYSISLHGREQFYIEAKKFAEDLDGTRRVNGEKQTFVEQAIDYAWHRRVDWAILTNFEEIRLYWTHVSKENPEDGLVFKLNYNEYKAAHGLERLSKLAKENVAEGSLKQLEQVRERKPVTKEILNVLSDARLELTQDIHSSHPDEELDKIREGVQRILDRLVVLRVAEDRNVLPSGGLMSRMENWQENAVDKELEPLWEVLRSMFRAFHRKYGTQIFDSHACDDYEISNDVLETFISTLDSYRFDVLSSDILGSIYEDYLGHAIEERGQELDLVAQEEVRRDDGIYYTPTPVVEYIVETTVGERLEKIIDEVRQHLDQDPPDFEAAYSAFQKVEDVKVLDNACGSGTFLIKAYDQFVTCYEEYKSLIDEAKKQVNGGDEHMGFDVFRDITSIGNDYQSDILQNNIYAVDQDQQAIEIASMNLVLRALNSGQELPPILGENLKTGNSLLNGTESEVSEVLSEDMAENAFDWETEFPQVFDDGGFTCITGNPPWGAEMGDYEDWLETEGNYELASGQYNSYTLFLELGDKILEEEGSLGYIIPDSIFNDDYDVLREWLLDNHEVNRVHKMGEGLFENVYHPTAILQYTKTVEEPDLDTPVEVSILKKKDRELMMGPRNEALKRIIQEKHDVKTQRRFVEDDDYEFMLWSTEQDYEIMEKMHEDTVDWYDVVDNGRGDETGQDGNIMKCPSCLRWDSFPAKIAESKGGGYRDKKCGHCGHKYAFEEVVSTRQIVSEHETDDCDRPIYFGEHVNRYRTSGSAYINDSYSDDLKMKSDWRFEPPKLLIRRASFGFFATIDYSDARSLKANLVFRPLKDREEPYDKYDLEYFLAFVNSRTMLYYWSKSTNTVEWESHIRHTQKFMMSLPVPEIDWDDNSQVEKYNELVETVREGAQGSGEVDEDTDWEIERAVMDLYGLESEQQSRILNELKEVQKMRIVRELFPDWVDEEDEE